MQSEEQEEKKKYSRAPRKEGPQSQSLKKEGGRRCRPTSSRKREFVLGGKVHRRPKRWAFLPRLSFFRKGGGGKESPLFSRRGGKKKKKRGTGLFLSASNLRGREKNVLPFFFRGGGRRRSCDRSPTMGEGGKEGDWLGLLAWLWKEGKEGRITQCWLYGLIRPRIEEGEGGDGCGTPSLLFRSWKKGRRRRSLPSFYFGSSRGKELIAFARGGEGENPMTRRRSKREGGAQHFKRVTAVARCRRRGKREKSNDPEAGRRKERRGGERKPVLFQRCRGKEKKKWSGSLRAKRYLASSFFTFY